MNQDTAKVRRGRFIAPKGGQGSPRQSVDIDYVRLHLSMCIIVPLQVVGCLQTIGLSSFT